MSKNALLFSKIRQVHENSLLLDSNRSRFRPSWPSEVGGFTSWPLFCFHSYHYKTLWMYTKFISI